MDKNIGKKLDGRYEITELIGIGGMADVYKAIDIIEDKTVAVKILKNEFSNDDDFLRRFRNESKAIAVLSHPNIVKVFDVGFTEKIQFIVMEYIDGITLKEFMEQQGILKWKDAIHFIIQILRALQHAHDRGIVHRDIKPQNIMLFPDGTIKVMDFGIARFAREEGKTLSDKAIGSVHYISPEQARGDITDEKSDIYSVGVMLYEMLTGQKPFDADNPVSVAVMHMQTKARNPRDINDTIPEGLEEIVLRAMQKDATKRYQSASEMIKDIEQFKKNPSIVFEYKYLTPQSDGDTKYFKPVSNRNERNNVKQEEYEEYQEDDDDEEQSRSMFVPILTAVTAAVFIIAAAFIVFLLIKPPTNKTIQMPNLVGMDYFEAQKKYAEDFTLKIETQEYSSYEKNQIYEQSKAAGDDIKASDKLVISVKVSKGIRKVQVPAVAGLSVTDAQNRLAQEDLKFTVIKRIDDAVKDNVIKTDPAENESVEPGTTITLYVSLGPAEQDVIVPYVVGKTQADATKDLQDKLQVKIEPKDSSEPAGTVIEQSIKEKEVVKKGTEIILTVSSGVVPTIPRSLKVDIPSGVSGAYDFNVYINGQIIGTKAVDNVGYVTNNQVDITVTGSGVNQLIVEIKNKETGKFATYAKTSSFDFTTGNFIPLTYDNTAFDTTSNNGYNSNDNYSSSIY